MPRMTVFLQAEEEEEEEASKVNQTSSAARRKRERQRPCKRERERFGPEGGRARRARNPQDPDTASSCKWRC